MKTAMPLSKKDKLPTPRRAYRRPVLRVLGSVQGLTLKIGSISDGMGPHPA